MSTYADPHPHYALDAEPQAEAEPTFPGRSATEQWLWELAEHEMVLDRIDTAALISRVMQDAFGRHPLPPQVAGLLASAHRLRTADPRDRQGIRQLATGWFTSQPPADVDDSTWYVRQVARRPSTTHLTLTGHVGPVTDVIVGTGRRGRPLIITRSKDETVRVWDPSSGKQVGSARPLSAWPENDVPSRGVATFSDAAGRTLVASPYGTDVEIIDADTGQQVGLPLKGHQYQVTAVAAFYGPAGHPVLVSASNDRTVRLWELGTRSRLGSRFATQHDDMSVITWFEAGGLPRVATIKEPHDNLLQIWDPTTGQPVGTPLRGYATQPWRPTHSAGVTTAAGTWLAMAVEDRVRIWSLTDGKPVGSPLVGHAGHIASLAAWRNSELQPRVASAGADGTIRVWEPERGRCLTTMHGHVGAVTDLVTIPTRHGSIWLISAGRDESLRLWNPDAGRQIGPALTGHTGTVTSVVSFVSSAGESLVASAGEDCTMRIWSPMTGRQVAIVTDGLDYLTDSVIVGTNTAGQTRLVTFGPDQTVRVWDPYTSALTYCLKALDYTDSIVWLRDGALAVTLDDGWAVLQLPDAA